MKKICLLGALLLIFAGLQAQDSSSFRKNIQELSSAKYAGRGYYKDNDGKAANYIAAELAKWGAVPVEKFFGKGAAAQAGIKGYFQGITFPLKDFNGKMELSVDGKKLQPGTEFIISSYSGAGKGSYELFYLDTTGRNLKQVIDTLVIAGKNRVVVMPYGMLYQQLLMGIKVRKIELGGVIALNSRELMQELVRMTGNTSMTGVSPLLMSKTYIEMLSMDHPDFVVEETAFPKEAKQVTFDIQSSFNPQESSSNVIAVIPGTQHPDSIFVFTAHYDHLGKLGKEVFYPGANDNASGTSMLLALAQYFSKPENKPAHTLVFAAVTGEEMGLLGSQKLVASAPFNLKNIKYVLNFDMVADKTDTLTTYSDKCGMRGYELLKRISDEKGLFKDVTYQKYQQNSDHYYFLRKRVPAICFIMEKGENFGKLHTPEDNMSHISVEKFNALFTMVVDFVKQY